MKKLYLIFCLLIWGLAGCKKNDNFFPDTPKTNGKPPGEDIITTPSDPNVMPALVNFKINEAKCVYDSSTYSYYYPVSLGKSLTNYTISYDTTSATAIYFDNVKINSGSTVSTNALSANEHISIRVVNQINNSVTYDLYITGLPIVSLNTNNIIIGDDKVNGNFSIIDPDHDLPDRQIETSSNIKISARGATSRLYPKKSYSVTMVDQSGEDNDVSLLGLRNDNKWILDAMYIDQGRMRNRLCTDIWNSFNNVPHIESEPDALNGTRGYMTEVFLNGKYHGVYCLTERLDRKQLKVKKQYGRIYKADDYQDASMFWGVSPFDNSSETWSGWEFEYPSLGDSPSPDWAPLYNLVYFVFSSSDNDFKNRIANKVDIDNMADYFILFNTVHGNDNWAKNVFLSFYDSRDAPKFFYSAWDLDATFGRNWDGSTLSHAIMGSGYVNNLYERLLTTNASNFRTVAKTRWNNLKNNQLSKTTIKNRIEQYRKQLVSTGAFARESARWGNLTQNLNTEAGYMSNWYDAQYDLMDNYFNSL